MIPRCPVKASARCFGVEAVAAKFAVGVADGTACTPGLPDGAPTIDVLAVL